MKTKPKVSDDYSKCGSRLEQSTMTFVNQVAFRNNNKKKVATDNLLVAHKNPRPYQNLQSFITAN